MINERNIHVESQNYDYQPLTVPFLGQKRRKCHYIFADYKEVCPRWQTSVLCICVLHL